MGPSQLFQFCPRCGAPTRSVSSGPFRCGQCRFLYFFNPCCAVAAFLLNEQEEALFVRRAKDPEKGKLALPGGFIDIGETAEDALRRETREEVGLELGEARFLCSQVNSYPYEGVTYPVLDLFFVAQAVNADRAQSLDGVESFAWLEPSHVDPAQIAFRSIREALQVFLASRRGFDTSV